ncbi:MAG: tetratricopeptide repeat protein [Myxococcota bacterium]
MAFSAIRSGLSRAALFLSVALLVLLALSACNRESPQTAPQTAPRTEPLTFPSQPVGALSIQYPLDETLFPPEIVAPTFTWQDETEGASAWQVLVRAAETSDDILRFSASNANWRPSEEEWARIKQLGQGQDAEIAVIGLAAGPGQGEKPVSSATVRIRTSADPVGDSIFYREVPLPFLKAVQDPAKIRWRFGSVDSQEAPPIVLENLPVCGNCHSFSQDGSTLGLDVDYGNDKGGYAIIPVEEQMVMNDEKIITWSDYKKDDGEATFGLLSQVSPDGRYVISTVKDRAVFVATPEIAFSQLFFPIKGSLVVYDTQSGTYAALPGADDPEFVQSNPTWSPDGQTIVFARAKAYRKDALEEAQTILLSEKDVPEFVEDKEPFKFDLYRVPFNEGRGGKAEPIAGASHNNKSNFFAKFSPDGKWIIFCKAENYMLLMPDSELFIIPAAGGEARRLRANTSLMNSWHSWSSNGKWLVFSSKANTPYTQLFLTHIDEEGNSTPPVVLERFTGSDRAANIPEFVPRSADSIAQIKERFLDAYSFLRAGLANERTGDYPGAVRTYRRGLEASPNNVELLNSLGFALFQQGESEEAVEALEQALHADPTHWKAHNNMALASIDLGELEIAEAHYRESLAIEPQPAIYSDLGFVLERQGLIDEAEEFYRESLKLAPTSAAANFNLAASLSRRGEFEAAESHFRAAVEQDPSGPAYTGLGFSLVQQGRLEDALPHLKSAIETSPKSPSAYGILGNIFIEQGKFPEAEKQYRQLVSLQPSAAAHENLARILAQLGRSQEAQREMAIARSFEALDQEDKAPQKKATP